MEKRHTTIEIKKQRGKLMEEVFYFLKERTKVNFVAQ